jgi:hypothetical protein
MDSIRETIESIIAMLPGLEQFDLVEPPAGIEPAT